MLGRPRLSPVIRSGNSLICSAHPKSSAILSDIQRMRWQLNSSPFRGQSRRSIKKQHRDKNQPSKVSERGTHSSTQFSNQFLQQRRDLSYSVAVYLVSENTTSIVACISIG